MSDISIREITKEIGVSHSTVCRVMQGQTTDISTAVNTDLRSVMTNYWTDSQALQKIAPVNAS